MSFRTALSSLIFFLAFTLSFAQPKPHDDINIELPTYEEVNTQKVFATDPDNKICFIDFMEIDGYAKELVVKNQKGEIIKEAVLWELPDNTLYELVYDEFPTGNYTIQLNTFSKILTKEIEVK